MQTLELKRSLGHLTLPQPHFINFDNIFTIVKKKNQNNLSFQTK